MIRTHKPIGHFWTCTSQYQETREFRSPDGALSSPPHKDVLLQSPNDDLSNAGRAAKRRRVGDLIDGFLEGKDLFISSAVATGPSLTANVNKLLEVQRVKRSQLESVGLSRGLWEDVEDDWVFLRGIRQAKRSLQDHASQRRHKAPCASNNITFAGKSVGGESVDLTTGEVVSLRPSEDAIMQAAALRERKNRRGTQQAQVQSLVPLDSASPESETSETETLPSQGDEDRRRSSTRYPTYIRIRKPLRPKTPEQSSMVDELRCSRTESPNCRPRPVDQVSFEFRLVDGTTELVPDLSASDAISHDADRVEVAMSGYVQTRQTKADNAETVAVGLHGKERHAKHSKVQSEVQMESGLAGIKTTINHVDLSSSNTPASTRREPVSIRIPARTASRSACTARRASQRNLTSAFTLSKPVSDSTEEKNATAASAQPDSPPITEQKLVVEANTKASGKRKTGRRSAGYVTPFLYRKRVPTSKPGDGMQHAKSRVSSLNMSARQVSYSGGEDRDHGANISDKSLRPDAAGLTSTSPQSLAQSIGPAIPEMATPLVAHHLNRILPKSPQSRKSSSSVRRALRRELRESGAELSRVEGEPSSSQPQAEEREEHDNGSEVAPQSLSVAGALVTADFPADSPEQIWPGTQAMILRANEDLLDTTGVLADDMPLDPAMSAGTFSPSMTTRQTRTPAQQTLRSKRARFSGAPLPNTQALMAEWSPWSAVKQTVSDRVGLQRPEIQPLDIMRSSDHRTEQPTSPFVEYTRGTKPDRRSSLRHSTVIPASPQGAELFDDLISASISDSAALEPSGFQGLTPSLTSNWMDQSRSSTKHPVGIPGTEDASLVFAKNAPDMSDSRPVQPLSPLALQEDSNPERTMFEIARAVLSPVGVVR